MASRYLYGLLIAAALISCKQRSLVRNPDHYDVQQPVVIKLKNAMREISGICFMPENDSILYAIEDERGRLYTVQFPSGEFSHTEFGSRGDYEDVVFKNGSFYILRSNGTIFLVHYNFTTGGVDSNKIFDGLIPAADYEGLASTGDTLLVLCKTCSDVKAKKSLKIYRLQTVAGSDSVSLIDNIEPALPADNGNKKTKVLPSALAQNPIDKNWYILSAENFQLLIYDSRFNPVDVFDLPPAIYPQPEGIAFNSRGDLLISSEGRTGAGSIMVIPRK
jgi:uncharacterized protein YjiK